MTSHLFSPDSPTFSRLSQRWWQFKAAATAHLRSLRWLPSLIWFGLLGTMVTVFFLTGVPVTLVIDGHEESRFTHQLTVDGLLREADLGLNSHDIISAPPSEQLSRGQLIEVQRAHYIVVEADGKLTESYAQTESLAQVLTQAGITLREQDVVLLNGQPHNSDELLPRIEQSEKPSVGILPKGQRSPSRPLHLEVKRAMPVTLTDAGATTTFYTTQPTVGEALYTQDVLVYLGDQVSPDLHEPVTPDMHISIDRSTPIAIVADGRTIWTRTRGETVAAVLNQEGILLQGKDRVTPALDATFAEDTAIQVTRVREELKIMQQVTPFETVWVPADDMPIDSSEIVNAGQNGVTKSRYRIVYENGQEIGESFEDEWLDQVPEDKTVAYGTAIQTTTIDTPEGPVEYWRHFRALATSYSAATSGKPKDHPRYGITRSGLPAGYGIIAVDPKVIPLGTKVYVPGYGVAIAGDTGGAVIGRHVDLGFDEDDPPIWYRWVDVYLLAPVPAPDDIRFVLPNWPQEG
jgi:resuscitation-promoting factor RpfB